MTSFISLEGRYAVLIQQKVDGGENWYKVQWYDINKDSVGDILVRAEAKWITSEVFEQLTAKVFPSLPIYYK